MTPNERRKAAEDWFCSLPEGVDKDLALEAVTRFLKAKTRKPIREPNGYLWTAYRNLQKELKRKTRPVVALLGDEAVEASHVSEAEILAKQEGAKNFINTLLRQSSRKVREVVETYLRCGLNYSDTAGQIGFRKLLEEIAGEFYESLDELKRISMYSCALTWLDQHGFDQVKLHQVCGGAAESRRMLCIIWACFYMSSDGEEALAKAVIEDIGNEAPTITDDDVKRFDRIIKDCQMNVSRFKQQSREFCEQAGIDPKEPPSSS